MSTVRSARPAVKGNRMSRTVLSVVRILIASYFLATATGLIFDQTSRTFLDGVLVESHAQLIATIYLFVTAFAIMVGFIVRPAALLLSVYVFWSGFVDFSTSMEAAALSAFWRNMALLGALLLVAVTEPGGSTKFRLWAKPIAPRRIARARMRRMANRPNRPSNKERLARTAMVGVSFEEPQKPKNEAWDALDDIGSDDQDVINIFDGIWDKPATPFAAS